MSAPSWHELVKPGPKGSEKRRKERLAIAADVARRTKTEHEFHGPNRAERRASGQVPHPGRLVLHRTRLRAVDGGERPSVLRRRAERAARVPESSPLAATGSASERVTPVAPAGVGGQPEHTNPE